MSLIDDETFTEQTVAALALAAGLPLASGRAAVLLPILRAWLADSAALNTLMHSEACREVLPVVLFKHGSADGEGGP